jgi:Ca-activated chloride channel family protein
VAGAVEPAKETGGSGFMRHGTFILGTWLVTGLILVGIRQVAAQSARSLVNSGNDQYKERHYTDAEVNYRKALEKDKGLAQGHFNLGDALHKQGKFDEAIKEYGHVLGPTEQKSTRSSAYYNVGNSYMKEQRYQDAVQSYVESLKLDPNDEDARYNLSYALEKLRQQQQQQQNKNQDRNNNKKNNQQQNQDRQKNQQEKNQKQDQQQRQQYASQQQKRMSKEDAERILDVLKNSEKDVQRKLRVRQAVRPKTDKDW